MPGVGVKPCGEAVPWLSAGRWGANNVRAQAVSLRRARANACKACPAASSRPAPSRTAAALASLPAAAKCATAAARKAPALCRKAPRSGSAVEVSRYARSGLRRARRGSTRAEGGTPEARSCKML